MLVLLWQVAKCPGINARLKKVGLASGERFANKKKEDAFLMGKYDQIRVNHHLYHLIGVFQWGFPFQ